MRQRMPRNGWGEMLFEGGTGKMSAWRVGGQSCQRADDHTRAMPGAKDAAAARAVLRAFLAGFGVGADARREPLVEQLLSGALARHRGHADKSLAECAKQHVADAFEAWLTVVLGAERLDGQPALPVGRAAFLACDGATVWPDLILVEEDLPEAFVTAMRTAAPSLAPMPTPGTMTAQSLEAWSIADVGRAVAEALDANGSWPTHARSLITVPIKLTRPPA
jgi:hypothetical protein